MNESLLSFLQSSEAKEYLRSKWLCDIDLTIEENYELICDAIQNDPNAAFIAPLSSIPLERPSEIQLACLFPRIFPAYYLKSQGKPINLSLLGESHTIYTNDVLAKQYIQDINQNVKLVQEPQNEAYFIQQFDHWIDVDDILLEPREFIPPPSSGYFVVVCHKNNMAERKKWVPYHSAVAMELSNLERNILNEWRQRKDFQILGIYLDKDYHDDYHLSMSYLYENELEYVDHSQSTSFQFIDHLRLKMPHGF